MTSRRAPFRIFALSGALLVTLAVCEAGLRLAGPSWLLAHMKEVSAGRQILGEGTTALSFVEHTPDGRFARLRPGTTFSLLDREFQTDVHVTAWGTRVTGADEAGPDTVVFIGDSFTFGMGVNDDQTFASLVCRERRLACLNAGFPSSALPNQLDVVEANFAAWRRPRRLVFVFFAGNDLPEMIALTSTARAQAVAPPPWRTRAAQAINRTVNAAPVLSRSYLLQLVKATSRAWVAPGGMDFMFVTASGARGDFARRASEALEASLDRLERVASTLGFTPVFVMIPDRYQVSETAMLDKARYYRLDVRDLDMRFPQQLLSAALDRRRITYLDLLRCPGMKADGLYYRSDNHLTPAGHAAVGRCLLRADGLL